MKSAKKLLMWVALVLLLLLVVLSVASAFMGSVKARQLFNSVPLVVYWVVFGLLLIAAFIQFKSFLHQPSLFMLHAGPILVLAGAMWGSEGGHELARKYFGSRKIQSGYMVLPQGATDSRLMSADIQQELGKLPFKLHLRNFWLEYYRSGSAVLTGKKADGTRFELPCEAHTEFVIDESVKIKVLQSFKNFKVTFLNGKRTVVDEPGLGQNPAVEIEITKADDSVERGYLFERFQTMNSAGREFELGYSAGPIAGISDYKSHIQILYPNEASPRLERVIEVNHPLHFAGYHFYQHSYDDKALQYSVLHVVSDSGLYPVYLGYWLLGLGVLGRFYLRPVIKYFSSKERSNNDH